MWHRSGKNFNIPWMPSTRPFVAIEEYRRRADTSVGTNLDKTTLPLARGSNDKHISGSNERRARNKVLNLIIQYHEESRLETGPELRQL
jgi:hypothetical protein